MKIEAGKRYIRRDGVITGPLTFNENDWEGYPFQDPVSGSDYTGNGRYWYEGGDSDEDLILEYVPSDPTSENG